MTPRGVRTKTGVLSGGILAALLVLSIPTRAEEPDVAGTWTGTITTVGTRLQSSYSPITGVTLMPVPDLQISPSPFGPLVLASEGTYEVPALSFSGAWSVEGTSIFFSGGLSGAPARIETLETGAVIVIDMPLGDGTSQTVTYSRATP